MKFTQTTTTTTLFFAAAAVLFTSNNNNNVAEAVLSPYVTCCEEQGGKYEILNTSNGQSGFCKYHGQNYDEVTFYNDNCDESTPSPTPVPTAPKVDYKYEVYAVNDNCGLPSGRSVTATFTRLDDGKSETVDVDNDQCVYVGGTNEDNVDYTVQHSYVSGGHVSCSAIGNKNDGDCNLLGMAANACVINIC